MIQEKPLDVHPQHNNGFLTLVFNILIPVLILNKLSAKFGALPCLIVALAFPLGFGLYDFFKHRKTNFISVLGFVNVLITGSLAVLGLGGIWFCVKEAAFPLLIGAFVFGSSYTDRAFIKTLFLNPQIINLVLVEERLAQKQTHVPFELHLRKATRLLSLSFLVSAVLNFVIAERVFVPLDPSLDEAAKAVLLNAQIAKMTYTAMLVITVPSMICLMGVLWYVLSGIRRLTDLPFNEIFAPDAVKKT